MCFTGVYGPISKKDRKYFWAELGAIKGLLGWGGGGGGASWGDFNVIRFPEECSKEGRANSTMRRFSEVIEDLELRDLPLH